MTYKTFDSCYTPGDSITLMLFSGRSISGILTSHDQSRITLSGIVNTPTSTLVGEMTVDLEEVEIVSCFKNNPNFQSGGTC